jgi:hypothetical protein
MGVLTMVPFASAETWKRRKEVERRGEERKGKQRTDASEEEAKRSHS